MLVAEKYTLELPLRTIKQINLKEKIYKKSLNTFPQL